MLKRLFRALFSRPRLSKNKREDLLLEEIKRIPSQASLRALAVNPDLQPIVRIAALGRLDASGDDMRILIARSDHDPAVAIVALQTLSAKHRLREASDAKHDIVRLYACGYCSA